MTQSYELRSTAASILALARLKAGLSQHQLAQRAGVAATMVIDTADAALAEPIRALGMRVLVEDTVMEGAPGERRLAVSLLRALESADGA